MAKRKAAPRKGRSQQKSSSGLATWVGICALTIGAIWAYDNRAQLGSQVAAFTGAQPKAASRPSELRLPAQVPVPAKAPQQQPKDEVAQIVKAAAPRIDYPVPPKSIPQRSAVQDAGPAIMAAAAPSGSQSGSAAPMLIQPSTGQFSFCGRSGLKNCVEDGRVFWRDGKKQVLAGITVPRTDDAACVEERRRGFAAKMRLRDFLNAGSFQQSGKETTVRLSRNGRGFEEQLLREGLAMPVGQKNQSWCG